MAGKAGGAKNLHARVTEDIGESIVSGVFAPGDALPGEAVLAEQMAVSRTVLREALKVLASKGLIETRQKTGMRVREPKFWKHLDADVLGWRCASMPTEDFVEKLVEMREIIEPAAVMAAARRREPEQLAVIAAALKGMEDAADLDAWAAADLRFHEAVLAATNNELLSALFSVIETALATFFVMSARTAKHFKYSLPQHRAVYEAIRRRRPNEAAVAVRALIADSRANMRKGRKK
ncbi:MULTISPECIES: FadR/GntR family transcriptional regulator [Rhodanobacteraceae]|uniref:FadR/GntR family transcriptional regulator n=1 Tax=Rhodanobacteraceae TaxID=1775411 RepID=UPI00088F54DB|nr:MULTISPECIES: FadR/GntR family transcriptional regulator [Rhodanobacteraceae]SDF93207.1 DNA-binding transcriptional regulator, FadR family [Dyella sp. 333MFSha]SKB94256.1 DNA-binding transcriptional regulator, FadR family [Luteibacter sp. 22Crub2.1]